MWEGYRECNVLMMKRSLGLLLLGRYSDVIWSGTWTELH